MIGVRRVAAQHLEPLPDGRRDPLDERLPISSADRRRDAARLAWLHLRDAGVFEDAPSWVPVVEDALRSSVEDAA